MEPKRPILVPFDDYSLFGKPNSSLAGPPKQLHRSSTDTPPQLSRSTTLDYVIGPESFPSSHHTNGAEPASRKPTLGEIERERHAARIPSSKSPSPLKIPASGDRASSSPIKVPNEVTKALQDSITSLLGKRPSEDEETINRMGKRARPHPKLKVIYICVYISDTIAHRIL